MARRLFFVDEVHSGQAEIRGEEARHLTRVLRVEEGQKYEISDNGSLYLALIETARKEHVVFRVLEKLATPPPGLEITLLASLIKFDHFEWILEKATELGVTAIIPVEAERSEKGLDRGAEKRMERWRRIVLESCQQCRRHRQPVLQPPLRFAAATQVEAESRFFFEENPGAAPFLSVISKTESVALLVGPEGGWTTHERERAGAAGWTSVSLGRNVLRAETATIAALAVLQCATQSSVVPNN
jgi:16S rRNA (uracil1498-N3)-methyltransferase